MSGLRAPTVGGAAGGVGATTVARALHAREIGLLGVAGRMPDVVVCRATVPGLAAAERAAPSGRHAPPVLAVTAGPGEPDAAVTARLDRLSDGWSGPVVLPHVGHWVRIEDPYAEAADLLGRTDPPPSLRSYAEALGRIVALLTADDRLRRPEDGAGGGVLRPARGVRLHVEPAPRWNGFAPAGSVW